MMGNGDEGFLFTPEALLLQKAESLYTAVLQPITVQKVSGEATWEDSFTKLLAFNQTQYSRVLALDSDSTFKRSSLKAEYLNRVRMR